MYINLPKDVEKALENLDNEQMGLLFRAPICHAGGSDENEYEKNLGAETHMAYSFIVMWNDMQKEKFQSRRIKYNADARTTAT